MDGMRVKQAKNQDKQDKLTNRYKELNKALDTARLLLSMQKTHDTVKNNAAKQIKDAELLRSKPGGFKQLGSMGKSYKFGNWIDPRLFFKGDNE